MLSIRSSFFFILVYTTKGINLPFLFAFFFNYFQEILLKLYCFYPKSFKLIRKVKYCPDRFVRCYYFALTPNLIRLTFDVYPDNRNANQRTFGTFTQS